MWNRLSYLHCANRDLGGKNRKRHFHIANGIHIFNYFLIVIFYYSFFLGRMERFVAVEISGGMNDFAIWKGHL